MLMVIKLAKINNMILCRFIINCIANFEFSGLNSSSCQAYLNQLF